MTPKLWLFFFFMYFTLLMIVPLPLSADISEGFTPNIPPRLPVIHFTTEGTLLLDLDYYYLSSDDASLNGYGAGMNYTKGINEKNTTGFNVGLAGAYFTGDSNGTDMDGGSFPLNANLAYRVKQDAKQNIILLGGLYYAFTTAYIDTSSGIEINVHQWGPMLGAKGEFAISDNIRFIPYYVLKYDILYIDVWIGDNYYYYEDDVLSHIIGFDVEFAAISLGAMFDFFNTSDQDLIYVNLTFKL